MNILNDIKSSLGSITGNIYVDTLLMTYLIPIIIGHVQAVLNTISGLTTQTIQYVVDWIKTHIRECMVGKLVCGAIIYPSEQSSMGKHTMENILYSFIKKHIFAAFVSSDSINNPWFTYIQTSDMSISDQSDIQYQLNLHRSVDGDTISMFKSNVLETKELSKKTVHFQQGDEIISLTLQVTPIQYREDNNMVISPTKEQITVEIYSSNMKCTAEHAKQSFEKLLMERFKMRENIGYKCQIILERNYCWDFLDTVAEIFKHERDDYFRAFSYNPPIKRASNFHMIDNTTAHANMMHDKYILRNDNDRFKPNAKITHLLPVNETERHSGVMFYKYFSDELRDRYNNGRTIFFCYENTYIYIIRTEGNTLFDNRYYMCLVNETRPLTHEYLERIIAHMEKISHLSQAEVAAANIESPSRSITDRRQRQIWSYNSGNWKSYPLDIREMGHVFLPYQTRDSILHEMQTFMDEERIYSHYGIKYKKGILFYGPPGTGKTSIVQALAYEFQMDIYTLNVNDETINDESIIDILGKIGNGERKFLLFEDIDTAFSDKETVKFEQRAPTFDREELDPSAHMPESDRNIRDSHYTHDVMYDMSDRATQKETEDPSKKVIVRQSNKYLTYSGLLNALDGLLSNQKGVITVMTTNYVGKLGEAFIRPGRIDVKYELGACNHEQIHDMMVSYIRTGCRIRNLPEPDNMSERAREIAVKLTDRDGQSTIKPCELQVYLLRHISRPSDILDKWIELLGQPSPDQSPF